ncbi:MAG: RluA family pseudouridine synthase, partial [Lactobacillales bacterium]|nr:RluA family pseudouridine synthase [Lactobacillales bacterium]
MSLEVPYTISSPLVTEKVGAAEENMRLDKFLSSQFSGFSRNQMIRAIETGGVSRWPDGLVVKKSDYHVKLGEVFHVVLPESEPTALVPQKIPLDILYEDDDLIVINKPAGMVVHPGAGNWDGTLVNALLGHCGDSLSGIGGEKRPGIVHRIDKDTSGILVVAKNDVAHQGLSEQFAAHTIERVYDAFVWGYITEKEGVVSGNIGRSDTNRQKMAVVKGRGKSAVTHYKRIQIWGAGVASYVKCILETGRTHQIR